MRFLAFSIVRYKVAQRVKLLKEGKKFVSDRDENGIKNFVKIHLNEFSKNIFYNITSAGIIALLSKIGIPI